MLYHTTSRNFVSIILTVRTPGLSLSKSENRRHECLESRVTNRVYQSCDSLRTCAEAVIFPLRVHVVYFILWLKCLLRMKGNTSGMSGTGLRCTMVCIAYLETVISLRNSTAGQPQAK